MVNGWRGQKGGVWSSPCRRDKPKKNKKTSPGWAVFSRWTRLQDRCPGANGGTTGDIHLKRAWMWWRFSRGRRCAGGRAPAFPRGRVRLTEAPLPMCGARRGSIIPPSSSTSTRKNNHISDLVLFHFTLSQNVTSACKWSVHQGTEFVCQWITNKNDYTTLLLIIVFSN